MVAGLKGNDTAPGQARTYFRHIDVIFPSLEAIASVLPAVCRVLQGLIHDTARFSRQNSRTSGRHHTAATAPKDMGYFPKSFPARHLLAFVTIIQR
jgi:hypothetical protein